MPNGRCRFHGGPSTGPRMPEGLERSRKARWKHGRYSAKAIEDRRELRALLRHVRELSGGQAMTEPPNSESDFDSGAPSVLACSATHPRPR